MGSKGDSYDNALAETINGLYKAELIHRRAPWKTKEAVEFATLERVQWKLPYAAIEPPPPDAQPRPPTSPASPPPAASPKPTRADFARGDKVSFTDRHLQTHVGVITRSNPKTATVDTGEASWSVPYGGLRRVLDI